MVESPRERPGVPTLALSMIPAAVVLTLALSISCTQRRSVESNTPVLNVGPAALAFTAIAGGDMPPYQKVIIHNAGGGTLNFTAARKSSWLQIFWRGTAPDTIKAFAYSLGLKSGAHHDTIIVSSEDANNSPVRIPVSFEVLPGISVSPGIVARTVYTRGPAAIPETLEVISEGGGNKIYEIDPSPAWLNLGYPVGLASNKVAVNFLSQTLPSGIYSHEIVITSTEAANLSVRALCSLMVEPWRVRHIRDHHVLKTVRFVSHQVGWAAGFERQFDELQAALFRTTDSGISWQPVDIPPMGALSGLLVAGDNRLWFPADSGKMLVSSGTGFEVRVLPTLARLIDIVFAGRDTGWVVGEQGAVLRTTDSGNTWVQQTTHTSQTLNAVTFLDSWTGWAVGGAGTVIATSDGGETWYAGVAGPIVELNDIIVAPDKSTWVVGAGGTILYRATLGGKWLQIPSGVTEEFHEITFMTAEIGWIIGSRGTILHTTNGGMTWRPQLSNTQQPLFSVFPLDSVRVFVAGNDALILDSYSGGE